MFSTELLELHLKTEFLGSKINYQSETNSTNIDAWNHINDDCAEGTIFITDNQIKKRIYFGEKNNIQAYEFKNIYD